MFAYNEPEFIILTMFDVESNILYIININCISKYKWNK